MKKIVAAALLAALAVTWGAAPAQAGSRARLRWEGAAIALGTLGILTVLNEAAHAQPAWVAPPGPYFAPPARPYPRVYAPPLRRYEPDVRRAPGYWEETNVWVPGVWGLVWVWDDEGAWRGGRHDHDGYRWDDRYRDRRGYRDRDRDGLRRGHYEERRSGGHFERRRVWRDGRDRHDGR